MFVVGVCVTNSWWNTIQAVIVHLLAVYCILVGYMTYTHLEALILVVFVAY